MPYIPQKRREELQKGSIPENPGELNYMITLQILLYITRHAPSYKTYNDVIGALECAKLELYRRAMSKYEDEKIKQNGDVY